MFWQQWQRNPLLKADCRRWSGHGDPSRYCEVFHDHPRGGSACYTCRRDVKGGEILYWIWEPGKIVDLAKDLIRLSGFEPGILR